jgi:hypothetical protein
MSRKLPLSLSVLVLVGGSMAHREAPAVQPAASAPAASDSSPDAAVFDRVLAAHVRRGRVDYAGLKADRHARAQLDAFLAAVASMPESAPLSDWLNAYNALVIQLVLERYPLDSVSSVAGFFKTLERPVAGKERSLDAIEHGIIRPRFKDSRVHFALNCAAISCPPLRARAFRTASLDSDLDELAQRGVADPRHVSVVDGKLLQSAIFFWFEEDFERDAGSVVAWI